MNLEKSLELFGIKDIFEETEQSIKTKYKKLMIKYHPDNFNGDDKKAKDISSAFEIIKVTLNEVKKYKEVNKNSTKLTIVIPLSKLINIYNGQSLTIEKDNETYNINKGAIQRHNTLIISSVTIIHNGLNKEFSNIQHWSISDNYEINCELYVENINDKETVIIKLEDFEKEISFSSMAVSIKIQLKFNITVEIRIHKKLEAKESQ